MTDSTATTPRKGVLSTLLDTEHYSSIVKELTCTKCGGYMRPPVHICVDGHSICGACYQKAYQCHVCQKEFSPVRSAVLESLVQKVLFPCDHAGCPRRLTLAQLEQHSPSCQFRHIDCFMGKVYPDECKWRSCAGDWLDHCFAEHKKRVTELPFIRVRDKWNPKRQEPVVNYFLMKCYDKVFNVYQIYDKKTGRMMWTVLVNEDAEKFYYEVEIFLPDQPTKKILYRRPCKCEKDADFLEQTQNVFLPIETLFCMLDARECANYVVRIGEVDNLAEQETSIAGESLVLLQDNDLAQ